MPLLAAAGALAVGLLVVGLALLPDQTTTVEQEDLTSNPPAGSEFYGDFGISVAVSGDIAVVSAHRDVAAGDDAGAAYIFERNEGGPDNWREVKKLTASDAQAGDEFGISVAVSGDTVVVGAYRTDAGGDDAGAAYIFERNEGGADNWGEVAKLVATDAQAGDLFGSSVAIVGDAVVVGAASDDAAGPGAGAAYVFERGQGGADSWGEVKKLTASDAQAGDEFGWSVAVSGDTVVVGAVSEDTGGDVAGATYVFERDEGGAGNWGEVKKLTASTDARAYLGFGWSVAVSGDTAVVGANGAAYVFSRDQGGASNWGQVAKLTAPDGRQFGSSVAVNDDTAVVGADRVGTAHIFRRDQGGTDNWGQAAWLPCSGCYHFAGFFFGWSVALSGDSVVVGAPFGDGSRGTSGAAYVYRRDHGGADQWGEVKELTASEAEAGN